MVLLTTAATLYHYAVYGLHTMRHGCANAAIHDIEHKRLENTQKGKLAYWQLGKESIA